MHHNACAWLTFLHRFRRFTRFPLYCVTMRVFFTFLCTRVSLSFKTPHTFYSVRRHNACVLLAFLYCFRRLTRFPLYCITMRVFFTFLCTSVSLSFKTPYVFPSVWLHNACVSHVYLYRLGRFQRFPLYCVTMRVFYTFFCTRVSLSFKTPYAFSSVGRHNACVLLAFLHRFRRLTRFPPYGVTIFVFFTFFCTSISLSPYAFASVMHHNAWDWLTFLHRFRRFTRFPLYCVTMRVFFTFLCTRVSLSFKTPHTFYSVRRHNACVLLAFLYCFRRLTRFPLYCTMRVLDSRFCIVLDAFSVFLCIASQCVCFTRFSALAFLYHLRRPTRFPP